MSFWSVLGYPSDITTKHTEGLIQPCFTQSSTPPKEDLSRSKSGSTLSLPTQSGQTKNFTEIVKKAIQPPPEGSWDPDISAESSYVMMDVEKEIPSSVSQQGEKKGSLKKRASTEMEEEGFEQDSSGSWVQDSSGSWVFEDTNKKLKSSSDDRRKEEMDSALFWQFHQLYVEQRGTQTKDT